MERDALIGHGTAFLLQDRLLNCSDYTQSYLCKECGSVLTAQVSVPRIGAAAVVRCRRCATKLVSGAQPAAADDGDLSIWEDGSGNKFYGGNKISTVAIPFVLKYLDSELAAMGIRMKFNVTPA
jgi:DNA-directed RNA polymerase I subunit RPA2